MRTALAVVVVLTLVPDSALAFRTRARHAGVFDVATGEWLYEKDADAMVPVASLTKIAAALTFRRLTDDLEQLITIQREDWVGAGRTRLRVGDQVPARTLLQLMLVASDNCAARSLAHAFGYSWEVYGFEMQRTAWGLGCRSTVFVEPSGLDPHNRATVRDVVTLFRAALRDPVLRTYMGTQHFVLQTKRGPRNIVHSSRTLRYRREVKAAKTGYLDVAGYCMVQYVSDPGGDFITVVLGAPTKSSRSRESIRLCDYARRNRAPHS